MVLINRPEAPPVGAGEGTQGPVAAAIGNAIHNALGARLRDLPFTRDRIVTVLAGRAAGQHVRFVCYIAAE